VYIGFLFWRGRIGAWRWGGVVGVLACGLIAADASEHFFEGFATNNAIGLLKWSSDVTILMIVIPLVYFTVRTHGALPKTLLVVSVLGATIPLAFGTSLPLVAASYAIPTLSFLALLIAVTRKNRSA